MNEQIALANLLLKIDFLYIKEKYFVRSKISKS